MNTLSSIDRMLKQMVCLLALAVMPFGAVQAAITYCGSGIQTQTLFAGQTTNSGAVTVGNDANNLYVTFTTTGGWELQKTHLHIGDTLTPIPVNKAGNPQIGQFSYQTSHSPRVTTYTYTIAKTALSLDPNQSVTIAAHAEVAKVDASGNVIATETGWAAGSRFTDRGSWATYFKYIWQDCAPDKPLETKTETAFAYNGAEDGACFLDLALDSDGDGVVSKDEEFNRWGWTIGPLAAGNYKFDLYAGAGQCALSKGTKVGYLTVDYDGKTATVTYQMEGSNATTKVPYNMVEAQLYVGNEILPKDVKGEFTVAPGQYPDKADELKGALAKTFTVEGLEGDIYVIAHATVAGFPK